MSSWKLESDDESVNGREFRGKMRRGSSPKISPNSLSQKSPLAQLRSNNLRHHTSVMGWSVGRVSRKTWCYISGALKIFIPLDSAFLILRKSAKIQSFITKDALHFFVVVCGKKNTIKKWKWSVQR